MRLTGLTRSNQWRRFETHVPTKDNSIILKPSNEVQKAFVNCTARESLMDGGVGSSKTYGGLIKLLLLADHYPGSRWFVARQFYKDLMNTTKASFDKLIPKGWVVHEVMGLTTLANGSEIIWAHLDDYDIKSLAGLEITGAFLDQAEEISPDCWEMLDSRIGRWNVFPSWDGPAPSYIWGTSNPNGKDWLYWHFHPDIPANKINSEKAYFFAPTDINKECLAINAPGYYENLMRKSPTWRKRWVEGSRDMFEGKIFPEFTTKGPHIYQHAYFSPYRQFPDGACWGWLDYGLTSPTTHIITYTTKEKFMFVTSEYGQNNKMIKEHAANIVHLCRTNPKPVRGTIADPSVFHESTRDRRVMANSIDKEFRTGGLYLLKGDNNEESSLAVLHEMLFVDPLRMNPITGKLGSPLLFISDECPNLIKELDAQRYNEERNPLTGEREWVGSRNSNIADHYVDPLRYFANSKIHTVNANRPQPTHQPRYTTYEPRYGADRP